MPNIMNQTQWPWVTHEAILHAIWRQLIALTTEIWTKINELMDHPCLAPAEKSKDWPRDCNNYIGATDAPDAWDKVSRRRLSVGQWVDSQYSAESKKDGGQRKNLRRHSQWYWYRWTVLPSSGWNCWNSPTLLTQREPGCWQEGRTKCK